MSRAGESANDCRGPCGRLKKNVQWVSFGRLPPFLLIVRYNGLDFARRTQNRITLVRRFFLIANPGPIQP